MTIATAHIAVGWRRNCPAGIVVTSLNCTAFRPWRIDGPRRCLEHPAQNVNELEDGELRVAVLNLIEKTAREIQTQGREPDQWAGPDLVLALDYLQQQGWANAALRVVQRALAEPGDRGAIPHHPPSEIPPATRSVTGLSGAQLEAMDRWGGSWVEMKNAPRGRIFAGCLAEGAGFEPAVGY